MSRLNTKSRIELAHLKRQLELRVQPPWKTAHLRKETPAFPSSVTKSTLTASKNLLSTPNTTTTNKKTISSDTTPTTANINHKNINVSHTNKNWNSYATATTSRSAPVPAPPGQNEAEPSLQPQSLLLSSVNNSTNNNANDNASRPSKFDYKFVFTNTAMRKEDRIFRVKNPGVAIEKDMKIVKPLMATTSFLPYGVTIRNPHMFEEDQLAVIQRRQQVHNITYPTPQYNPFMTVRRERGSKSKLVNNTSRNNSNRREGTTATPSPAFSSSSPAPVSAPASGSVLVSTTPSQNTGPNAKGSTISQMNSTIHTPIIPNRYSSGHAKANRRVRLANALQNKNTWGRGSSQLNSTALRDNQFRQQIQNLEKSTTPTVEGNGQVSGEMFLRSRHKQAVDNLSNTVQHLNRYEERLKHYLKSKNTMAHAAGALKQLWSLRSKKISQLSQLAVTLPDTSTSSSSGNNTRQLLRSQPAFQNLSNLTNPNRNPNQTMEQTTTTSNSVYNNNSNNKLDNNGKAIQTQEQTEQSSNGLPKHPQNYLADRKFIKSPLDTQKISKVIGKKNWSSMGERNKRSVVQRWTKEKQNHILSDIINSKNSMIINGTPDTNFKITPLQAAMMEEVDLDQISDLIGSPKPVYPNQSQQIGPMPVKTHNNNHNNNSRNNSPSPLTNTMNDPITSDNTTSSLLAERMKPTVSLFRYNDRDRDIKLLRPTNKQRLSNLPLFNNRRENNLSPFNFGSERSSQHNWGGLGGIESRRESQIFRKLYNEYHIHEDKIQNELKKEEWSGRKSREKKQSDQSSKRIVELNKQLNYRKVVKL